MPSIKRACAATLAASLLITVATAAGSARASRTAKLPADSSTPTAGFCDVERGRYVVINVGSEEAVPRCVEVRPGQRLRIRNDLDSAIAVRWRPYARTDVRPGGTATFDHPFAAYLQPGDHRGTAGRMPFEIFMPGKPAPTASPTAAG